MARNLADALKQMTFTSEDRFFWVNRSARLTFEWRFGQMNAGSQAGKED